MTTRLLFVSFNLAGGGAERVLVNLLEGLDSHEFHSTCVFYDSTHDYPVPAGVPVHTLGLPGSANRSRRIRRLAEVIDAVNPDVVFSFLTGVNLEVLLAYRESGSQAALIVSEHNRGSVILAGSHNSEKRAAVSTLYRDADAIVTVSAAIRCDLIEHFGLPAARIRVIHNPVDLEAVNRLKTEATTEHRWPGDDLPVVINVAAVKPRKGQDLLLTAFRAVRDRTACRLMFVGSGTDTEAFRSELERSGVSADVRSLGFQTNPFGLMARAAVFVLPSRSEGFPNVLLEAMACGVPVITTDWAGAEEIVIDGVTGLVVPMDDELRLATAITELLNDRDRARRLASAATVRLSLFVRPRIIRRYARLLHAHARRARTRRTAVERC